MANKSISDFPNMILLNYEPLNMNRHLAFSAVKRGISRIATPHSTLFSCLCQFKYPHPPQAPKTAPLYTKYQRTQFQFLKQMPYIHSHITAISTLIITEPTTINYISIIIVCAHATFPRRITNGSAFVGCLCIGTSVYGSTAFRKR